jgi:hypothetical protein
VQLPLSHDSWGYFPLVLHAPENHAQKVKEVIVKQFCILCWFSILEHVVKCHQGNTEVILNGFVQFLLVQQLVAFLLEWTILLFELLVVVLLLLHVFIGTVFESGEKFKLFSQLSQNSVF